MNRLSPVKRTQVVNALVEGNSLRAAARLAGVSFNTVLKLPPQIGQVCEEYQRRVLVNLPCKRIQCDEIWSFCYAKDKNLPHDKQGRFGFGSVWTWTAPLCGYEANLLMEDWDSWRFHGLGPDARSGSATL